MSLLPFELAFSSPVGESAAALALAVGLSFSAANASSLTADRIAFRDRFAMGSREMVRCCDTPMDPMSTFSISVIFCSQVVVGPMDVGRVRVARIK